MHNRSPTTLWRLLASISLVSRAEAAGCVMRAPRSIRSPDRTGGLLLT